MNKSALSLDIGVGDVILGGKYKNRREIVKELGTDSLGQPTVNGKKLLTIRIEKTLPEGKKSRETREQAKSASNVDITTDELLFLKEAGVFNK